MKSYLCDFVEHEPPETLSQEKSIDWLEKCHTLYQEQAEGGKPEQASKFVKRFGVSSDYISARRSYVPGIGSGEFGEGFFNPSNLNPNLEQRSEVAQMAFQNIFSDIYEKESSSPDHLFHVSCTHYQSPSAAQDLVSKKGWRSGTTHLYHMGCYASLPAVRAAKSFVSDGSKRVDVVHTEICSIHINSTKFHPEQVIVQTLFADGGIKYSCVNENQLRDSKLDGLEVLAVKEMILEGTQEEMTWKTGAQRFDMTLSKNAPEYLAANCPRFCEELFESQGLSYQEHKESCEFAVHPGGPKIVESVQEALKLSDDQVAVSKDVLRNRGNMSSATLPHIWKRILENKKYPYVVALGFGPGLTLFGALFKVCNTRG